MGKSSAPFAVLAFIMACSGGATASGGGNDEWQALRSLRGDTSIVRNVGVNSPAATVSLVEELAIGKMDGVPEEMFTRITEVRPLSDGGVLIYDGGAGQLRRYDAEGKYISSIGRQGQGPGEFMFPMTLAATSDEKVVVWDGIKGIMVFSLDGKLETEWKPEAMGNGTVGRNGHIFTRSMAPWNFDTDTLGPTGTRRRTSVATRSTIDGTVLDTIWAPPLPQPVDFVTFTMLNRPIFRSLPYSRSHTAYFSPHGYWVTTFTGEYAFTAHHPDGTVLRVEADAEGVPISEDERAFHLERFNLDVHRWDKSVSVSQDQIPVSKPFIKRIEFDADGRIWVQIPQPSIRMTPEEAQAREGQGSASSAGLARAEMVVAAAAPTVVSVGGSEGRLTIPAAPDPPTEAWVEDTAYDVFATDGAFLGRLHVPVRSTFAAARSDRVWLIVRDELDVQRLVRYRVTLPGREGAADAWR